MNKYTIKFNGRLVGAIGIFQDFSVTVSAESQEQAILKLYDTHDHIRIIEVIQ